MALYHDLVSHLAVKNTQGLINMSDDNVHMVCLSQETLYNNGGNVAWFGKFKLQYLHCICSEI